MANVYYFVNIGTSGAAWNGRFEVSSLDDKIGSVLPSSIVVNTPSFSFSPTGFYAYPPALYGEYVTWRTYTGDSQYPDTGYSFDLWSKEFSDNVIVYDFSWNDMISFVGQQGQGICSLRTDKHTTLYNYDIPCPVVLGKGGYIQLSTTPVP